MSINYTQGAWEKERAYVSRLCDHEILSDIENRNLVRAAKEGDKSAFNQLAAHNQRLVVKIASAISAKTGVELMDCIGYGNLGLVLAVRGFEAGADNMFSTYLAEVIRRKILSSITMEESWYGRKTGVRISKIMSNFKLEHARYPNSKEELFAWIRENYSPLVADRHIFALNIKRTSLDELKTTEFGEVYTRADEIPDVGAEERVESGLVQMSLRDFKDELYRVMNKVLVEARMNAEDTMDVFHRNMYWGHPFEDIARDIISRNTGNLITRQRAQQLKNEALNAFWSFQAGKRYSDYKKLSRVEKDRIMRDFVNTKVRGVLWD